MEFNAEKEQLIAQIQQNNALLDEFISKNRSVRLLNNEQLQKLEDIKGKNDKFKHKLESNEFEIAIVGLEKAGKSTFANALIKNTILPSAPERCTFTSTRLVSGSDKASVQFYTEAEFEQIFQELLQEIEYGTEGQISSSAPFSTLSDSEKEELEDLRWNRGRLEKQPATTESAFHLAKLHTRIKELEAKQEASKTQPTSPKTTRKVGFKSLSLANFDQYFHYLEEKNPSLYKNHVGKTDEEIRDILKCRDRLTLTGETRQFAGHELKTDAFQAYIKGEQQGQDTSKPRSVKRIEIESSELKQLENAIIYDVPGFDSPTKIHIRQTEERLKQADAIILVTNVGTNPSLQGTTLSVITKNTDEDGIALKDKLFVFGNQLDRVNNEADIQGNADILIKDVEKYKIGERKRIFVGSAYKYLSDEKIIKEAKLKHHVDAGIDQIRAALTQYYQTERFEILKRKIDTNKKLMQATFEDVLKTVDFDENFSQKTEQAKITKSAYKAIEECLKWELQKLRDELKKEISAEGYFSNKFRQSAHDEMYFAELSEDEFERIRILEDDSVRLDLAINRNNQKAREHIHKQYLEDFTRLIKHMTDDKAKDIEIRLLRTFTTAIIGDSQSAVAEVEPLCKKYIHKITHEVAHSDNSFTYLIERFSRDVFDILLSAPILSQDRTNRYQSAIKEYIYLDSYYSNGNGTLINLLLNQKKQSLLDKTATIAGIAKDLLKIANGMNNTTVAISTLQGIINILKDTSPSITMKDTSAALSQILEAAQRSTTEEQVLKEINTDIVNLKDILVVAVVPASNLELAFLNGIDKQIKRLIAAFETRESDFADTWDDFIAKIVPIVKQSEFDQIHARIEAHELQKKLLATIKSMIYPEKSHSL
jgi:GTPase SAR1 family protein